MENKMKFREGQRAWSSRYGWGTIISLDGGTQYQLAFKPDSGHRVWNFTIDGKDYATDINPTLFHKEQVLDYSEPEIPNGTFGYFWDHSWSYHAVLGEYEGLLENGCYKCRGHLPFQNFCVYPELPPHLKDKSK